VAIQSGLGDEYSQTSVSHGSFHVRSSSENGLSVGSKYTAQDVAHLSQRSVLTRTVDEVWHQVVRACSRASQASNPRDPRIAALVTGIFHDPNPIMKEVAERVGAIHDALSAATVLCAGADDPACAGGDLAVVPEDLKSLLICPAFFAAGVGARRAALLRAAARLARLAPRAPMRRAAALASWSI
jgi:hypothetical protein